MEIINQAVYFVSRCDVCGSTLKYPFGEVMFLKDKTYGVTCPVCYHVVRHYVDGEQTRAIYSESHKI